MVTNNEKEEAFKREEMASFWNWVSSHKDYVGVQYNSEDEFWLYLAFDRDTLNDFTNEWQGLCEENGCACSMMMTGLCFEISALESGYGFTMEELWENRPAGIEDTLGECLY